MVLKVGHSAYHLFELGFSASKRGVLSDLFDSHCHIILSLGRLPLLGVNERSRHCAVLEEIYLSGCNYNRLVGILVGGLKDFLLSVTFSRSGEPISNLRRLTWRPVSLGLCVHHFLLEYLLCGRTYEVFHLLLNLRKFVYHRLAFTALGLLGSWARLIGRFFIGCNWSFRFLRTRLSFHQTGLLIQQLLHKWGLDLLGLFQRKLERLVDGGQVSDQLGRI